MGSDSTTVISRNVIQKFPQFCMTIQLLLHEFSDVIFDGWRFHEHVLKVCLKNCVSDVIDSDRNRYKCGVDDARILFLTNISILEAFM
jgi:hypothetical protein